MSLITNCVILEHDSDKVPPSHQEVIESGQMRALDMHRLVKGVIILRSWPRLQQNSHTKQMTKTRQVVVLIIIIIMVCFDIIIFGMIQVAQLLLLYCMEYLFTTLIYC